MTTRYDSGTNTCSGKTQPGSLKWRSHERNSHLNTLDDLLTFCQTATYNKEKGRPTIISVDGIIGAGKTSLLDELSGLVDPEREVIIREPVDKWTSLVDACDGMSLLEKFYTYPSVYAYMFQTVVLQTLKQSVDDAIRDHPNCQVLICERSVAASRYVFCEMLCRNGHMTAFERQVYENAFDDYTCTRYYPDNILYLDVSPRICFERMNQRGRKGEERVTMSYLEHCETLYHEWLTGTKKVFTYTPPPHLL
jgi:deoxyadenosine/deoxycytidine kinase